MERNYAKELKEFLNSGNIQEAVRLIFELRQNNAVITIKPIKIDPLDIRPQPIQNQGAQRFNPPIYNRGLNHTHHNFHPENRGRVENNERRNINGDARVIPNEEIHREPDNLNNFNAQIYEQLINIGCDEVKSRKAALMFSSIEASIDWYYRN